MSLLRTRGARVHKLLRFLDLSLTNFKRRNISIPLKQGRNTLTLIPNTCEQCPYVITNRRIVRINQMSAAMLVACHVKLHHVI